MANKLKLAQFYNLSSSKQRLEILKEVDASYSLPKEDYIRPEPRNNYAGYTYLHFAVKKADVQSTIELLSRGADVLQQGSHDGFTALHAAIDDHSDGLTRNVWEKVGVLEKNQLVNILLAAHVKSGKMSNPTSKKHGFSHLHIACMYNHAEAVKLLVKTEESVNQATNSDARWLPGCTPLHFAVRYSSLEAAAVLLEHAADVFAKDAKGASPLHVLIDRLLDVIDYLTMGREAIKLPYETEIGRINLIITSILKTRKPNDMHFIDDTGLSALHVASMLKDSSVAEYFLQQGHDINLAMKHESKICPGWTPLHFAACCSIDSFKLLLKNGAKTNIYNTRGLTALNLFTRRHSPEVIHSVLATLDEFNQILLTDKSTKLSEFILSMMNLDKFETFLKSLPDVNISVPETSPIWPGYSLLHLAVMMNEKTKKWEHFRETSSYSASTAFHEDVSHAKSDMYLYGMKIEALLSRVVIVDVTNADNVSPLQLAFKLHSAYYVEELMNCTEKNLVGPGNLSHLHIACATNGEYCQHFVDEFLRQGADINCRVETSFEWFGRDTIFRRNSKPHLILVNANSTPLHLAVIFGSVDAVVALLESGADVYAKDARGLTPIHLSMSAHRDSRHLAQILLSYTPNLRDSVTAEGLSHLHVAAFADSDISVEQLLRNGADVNARFDVPSAPKQFGDLEYNLDELLFTVQYAGETPLHVATRQHAANSIRALVVKGHADIYAESSSHRRKSPLHYALGRVTKDYFGHYLDRLKNEGEDYIGPIDDSTVTMLHVACAKFDLDWAKRLLQEGADPNARVRDDPAIDDEWRGETPLHTLVYHTSFEHALPRNFKKLAKLLLDNGADVTTLSDSGTPLHAAAEVAFPKLFFEVSDDKRFMRAVADQMLMSQENFNVNPVNSQGFSHLHYACVRNNVEIVKKFLDHGHDVNQPTDPFAKIDPGFQPLHYAFAHGSHDVAKILIERGADVRGQDRDGNTPLHIGIKNGYLDANMVDMLLSHGMDINAKNVNGATPLKCLLQRNGLTLTRLDCLLSRKGKIDVKSNEESLNFIRLAMRNALLKDRKAIFQKLVSMFDIQAAIGKGFAAIHQFVATRKSRNFATNLDLYVIHQFVKMGCDFDRYDVEGKTALHRAVDFGNVQGLEALLQLGTDIDIMSNDNQPLLPEDLVTEYHYGELDDYDDDKYRAIEQLANHAWTIQFAGLQVCDSLKEATQTILEEYPFEPDEIQCLEIELKKMESVDIINKITVKSFLSEWGAVRDHPAMADLQRRTIDHFFEKVDHLQKEFPKFSGILLMQYRKAIARMKLYEPAMNTVISLSSIALPQFCLDLILRDFSNEQLKYFVDIAENIHPKN